MKKNILIYLICINMLCFAIWNLPIYKYLCNLSVSIFENTAVLNLTNAQHIQQLLIYTSINQQIINFTIQLFYLQFFSTTQTDTLNMFCTKTSEIYQLYLQTTLVNANKIDFFSLQNKIYLVELETNLIFFRIYNFNNYSIFGITIYMISPTEYWFCINKIQCFCFEKIILHANECIDLPVLFFFNNIIKEQHAIFVNYIFVPYTYSSTVEP